MTALMEYARLMVHHIAAIIIRTSVKFRHRFFFAAHLDFEIEIIGIRGHLRIWTYLNGSTNCPPKFINEIT